MLFVTVWILKNIHVDSKESRRNRKQQELLSVILNCPEMQKELAKDLEGLNPQDLFKPKENQLMNALCELVPILILFITFVVYGAIIWTTDIDRAIAKRVTVDEQKLHQGIFIGLAFAVFFIYIVMALWFRLFQLNSYQVNCTLLILAIASYGVVVLIGIIYGNIVLDDVESGTKTTSITAFCIAPLYIFTIWIFYGIWMHNNYNFYQSSKLVAAVKQREEAKDHERSDSNGDLIDGRPRPNVEEADAK